MYVWLYKCEWYKSSRENVYTVYTGMYEFITALLSWLGMNLARTCASKQITPR